MKITLKRSDYEAMLSYARSQRPNEACGLIGGAEEVLSKENVSEQSGTGTSAESGPEPQNIIRHIEQVVFLTNTDHSPEHFSLDPKEQLQAVKKFRAAGWRPLGNWHSHPESPSRPSAEDIRLSFDSKATYMILSLQDDTHPVLNAFHVENGQVRREELEII